MAVPTLESEMQSWAEQQRGQFLAHAKQDQYAAGWYLTGIGLRRGEVLGLTRIPGQVLVQRPRHRD